MTLNFKIKIARTCFDLPILLPWQTPPTFMWTHFGQFWLDLAEKQKQYVRVKGIKQLSICSTFTLLTLGFHAMSYHQVWANAELIHVDHLSCQLQSNGKTQTKTSARGDIEGKRWNNRIKNGIRGSNINKWRIKHKTSEKANNQTYKQKGKEHER